MNHLRTVSLPAPMSVARYRTGSRSASPSTAAFSIFRSARTFASTVSLSARLLRLACRRSSSAARSLEIGDVPSEIRLRGSRARSVFFGTVFIRVFGTDTFRPVKEDAPIGFGRGPSCCEDALILDGELELQCLALIVGVGSPSFINSTAADILSAATLPCFPRGFAIDEPITFHHVQGLSVRRAVLIDGGKRPDLKSHGVDYHGVAFVVAHRVPIPGWRHLPRVRHIHAYTSNFIILVVDPLALLGLLQRSPFIA